MKSLVILSLISLGISASICSAEIYVSLAGNDTNPGTKEKPLRTLEGARDMIREKRKQKGLPKGGVTVYLRGGVYPRTSTFELTEEDSGTAESPIRYCSVKGETVRIIGGARLPASRAVAVKDAKALARIPASARTKVRALDLAGHGIKGFQPPGLSGHSMHYLEQLTRYKPGAIASEVFFNGRPLNLARWPNKGFSKVGKVIREGDKIRRWADDYKTRKDYVPKNRRKDPPDGFAFQLNDARVARWGTATDMMLLGYWHNNYSDQSVHVAKVDGKSRTIYSVQPSCYGIKSGQRFYAFNLLEELDAPGEWYVDHKSQKLYFYPPTNDPDATVSITVLEDPLLALKDVSHVTITGLTFSDTRGLGISIENGADVSVERCRVLSASESGMSIRGGTNHRVTSCEFAYLGAAGVTAKGGDVPSLTPAKHSIENNRIHNFARLQRTYNAGIGVKGVGIRVVNNEIAHAPHVAILFAGNEHVIEKNFIHNVVQEAEDMGAIYAGRSWTSRGTIIRNNLFKDVQGFRKDGIHYVKGIYLDDGISGIHITGNIFLNVRQGIMVNGGRDNLIEHNLFLHNDKMMRGTDLSEAYKGWAKASWGTLNKSYRASSAQTPLWRKRYPRLATILKDQPQFPKGNVVRNNACYKTAIIYGEKGINDNFKKMGTVKDNHTLKQSPGMFDSKQNRFVIQPNAELKKKCSKLTDISWQDVGLKTKRK